MAGSGAPTEPHGAVEAAYDERDLGRAMGVSAPDVRMSAQDGDSLTGRAAVRDRLEVSWSMSGRMAMRTVTVLP